MSKQQRLKVTAVLALGGAAILWIALALKPGSEPTPIEPEQATDVSASPTQEAAVILGHGQTGYHGAAHGAAGSGPLPQGDELLEKVETTLNPTVELEARWTDEAEDPRWASFETTILTAFRDVDAPGYQLVGSECRATLCRTEIALTEPHDRVNPMSVLRALNERVKESPVLDSTFGRHRLEKDRIVIYTAPPGIPLEAEVAAR